MRELLANPIGLTFVVILIGVLIGRVRVAGVSFGSSAVLFVAMAFAHAGFARDLKAFEAIGELGVVLFAYAIGLQAGPRFVRTFRGSARKLVVIGVAAIAGSALCAVGVGRLLGVEPYLVVGIYAGAMTSTPALAAALQAAGQAGAVPVGYGVAYPIGVVGVVLFAQLAPRWLKRERGEEQNALDADMPEPIHQRCFRVENPACAGRTVADLGVGSLLSANISRVLRGDQIVAAARKVRLETGDVVLAVGTERDLEHLAVLIGPPVDVDLERRGNVVARDVFLTERSIAGKPLARLQLPTRYGVVLTRVRREGIEFVPHARFVLELGDQVRAVGEEPDVVAFARDAGVYERRIYETGIPEFTFGLVVGLLLGWAALPLPGGGSVRLGMAGGPLISGLLFGHVGRIGRLRIHVPLAGKYLLRELGLVLFLVQAGTAAGSDVGRVLREGAGPLLILATAIMVTGVAVTFVLAYFAFRQGAAATVGLTCGAMTSTPGLGAATGRFESEVPALSYASIYPLALVAVTLAAKLLVVALHRNPVP